MLNKQYLLPLNYVRKTTKKGLNEKTLIVILFISTIITLFVIINNLPATVNLNDEDFKELFLPKLNKSNIKYTHKQKPHVPHTRHFKKTDDHVPIQPIEAPASGQSNLERREKIKSVIYIQFNIRGNFYV